MESDSDEGLKMQPLAKNDVKQKNAHLTSNNFDRRKRNNIGASSDDSVESEGWAHSNEEPGASMPVVGNGFGAGVESATSNGGMQSTQPFIIDYTGRAKDATCFLSDGKRCVDIVLVYEECIKSTKRKSAKRIASAIIRRYRQKFLAEMSKIGLTFEIESSSVADKQYEKLRFVKVHASCALIAKQAEEMCIKAPILPMDDETAIGVSRHTMRKVICGQHFFTLPPGATLNTSQFYKANYDRRLASMFQGATAQMFEQTERIRLTWNAIEKLDVPKIRLRAAAKETLHSQQLDALTADTEQGDRVTIHWLFERNIFSDVYPLHDSDCDYLQHGNRDPMTGTGSGLLRQRRKSDWLHSSDNGVPLTPFSAPHDHTSDPFDGTSPARQPLRYWLRNNWASFTSVKFLQPLEQVYRYFGTQVSLYFAWLGMYTKWLIAPTIVGLLALARGVYLAETDHRFDFMFCDRNDSLPKICRLCRSVMCPFRHLYEDCSYNKLSIITDNVATALFALFVCVWAKIFVQMWRRREMELSVVWDSHDSEYQEARPRAEYVLHVNSMRINPINGKPEKQLMDTARRKRLLASVSAVFFYILLVVAFIAAIMTYRIFSVGLFDKKAVPIFRHWGFVDLSLVTSFTASVLSGIAIYILSLLYKRVARKLTEYEYPRTDEEYNYSYSYKMFMFEFVNYYGTLFYLAIIKTQFTRSLVNMPSYWDMCPFSGCMPQVTIQLIVIFTGKQIVNNVLEIGVPEIRLWWRRRKNAPLQDKGSARQRAAQDYLLLPVENPVLSSDYLEMAIQYGFVVLFAAAFPLAPLLALLNNILEIRIDARKMLTEKRRPIPNRVRTIGPWLDIIDILTRLCVLTNALIIAFSTDLIDQMVYQYAFEHSTDERLRRYGFLLNLVVDYNTSDVYGLDDDNTLLYDERHDGKFVNICRYRGYYYHMFHSKEKTGHEKYTRDDKWFVVLCGRLSSVLLFVGIVELCSQLVRHCLPKIPQDVQMRVQRERFIAHEERSRHVAARFGNASRTKPTNEDEDE